MSSALREQEYENKVDFKVWRKLSAYALRHPWLVAGLIATLLLVAAIDLVYPLLTKYAIDTFIMQQTTAGIGAFAAVYGCLVLMQGGCVILFVCGAGKLEISR